MQLDNQTIGLVIVGILILLVIIYLGMNMAKEHMFPVYNPAKDIAKLKLISVEHMANIPDMSKTQERKLISEIYDELGTPAGTKEYLESGIPVSRPYSDLNAMQAFSQINYVQ